MARLIPDLSDFHKVLQHLNYEKLLMTTGIHPRHTRMTLDEIFYAANEAKDIPKSFGNW